jgi:S-methylmethionine-dependent homocysteine/selenocysteine methylase
MLLERYISNFPLILTECAITERLRRLPHIELHPFLFLTPLIYEEAGRVELEKIYLSYRNVALQARVPILLCAPTWRLDQQQTVRAGASSTINSDAVTFIQDLAASCQHPQSPVITGALIAPKNDCYSPRESLSRTESARFHSWQIQQLVDSSISVITAQTMPAVDEALGMADVLSATQTPYIISFVIGNDGNILDGTPLWQGIQTIDNGVSRAPAGYMINCVYPTFLKAETQPAELFQRLLGIQANASSKNHQQLDGSSTLQQNPLEDWGENMLHLHRNFGLKILGGCCGTDHSYLQFITDHLPA